MNKELYSGNEAIARGAWEAGAKVGTGYPGTPSSEILENYAKYPEIYTEWSVNEKVAYEVGYGSAIAGARTFVTMKHVGLNVAADPLFTSSYTGIKGGFVVVVADDPNMHSSQNEQDTRHYARASKIPALEPSDSQEAKDFTKAAFEISEKFDTPVILRSTTRISHARSVVETDDNILKSDIEPGFVKDPKKYVMIPAFARQAHIRLEERLKLISDFADETDLNRIELRSNEIGFITSGIAYNYLMEIYPDASILKLGMVFPLPKKKIADFFSKVKKVYIIEELEPFFETQIKALGYPVEGKKYLPNTGEFDPSIIKEAFKDIVPLNTESDEYKNIESGISIPNRPPSLCPGCPHHTVFSKLWDLGVTVSGDIGCYTLGVLPPYNAMDVCLDMGASVGVAQGFEIAENISSIQKSKVAAVIGDSTFAHSGITGLVNAAYNQRTSLIIVLDNGTTAMTGMQPNPFSGETLLGNPTFKMDYKKLAESVGIEDENYRVVDAYKSEQIESAITEFTQKDKLSLLVVKGTCIIYKRKQAKKNKENK